MGIKSFIDKINKIADEPYKKKDDRKGVFIHNEKLVSKGDYRLYNGNLIDYKGKIIKKFKFKYLSYINGKNYYAQNEYEGDKWGKFTLDDEKVWIKKQSIHHEILVDSKKQIITLDKESHEYKGRIVDFDVILWLDSNGSEIKRWSTYKSLIDLQKLHPKFPLDFPKIPLLKDKAKRKDKSPWGGNYDYYRLNSVSEIEKESKRDSAFKRGNLILSFRHGSIIAVLDIKTLKIVWSMKFKDIKGNIEGQHSVKLLDNGNILIFDNGRYRESSRIIEVDPKTKKIEFEYKDKTFYTLSQGYVDLLSNGNYLVTESENGRVFEITKESEIVWEFFNPIIQSKKNSKYPSSYGTREWVYRCYKVSKSKISKN